MDIKQVPMFNQFHACYHPYILDIINVKVECYCCYWLQYSEWVKTNDHLLEWIYLKKLVVV